MAETHVISALRAKRAELAGDVTAAEHRIVQLRADLDALDNAIRVFDPTIEPATIKPRLKRRMSGTFPHGEFARIVLTVLQRAKQPMTAREIAAKVAADYHVDVGTPALLNPLVSKVRNVLGLQKPDVLTRERRGDVVVWKAV